MWSDLDAYRNLGTEPVGLRPGATGDVVTVGVLLDLDEPTNRALVSVYDSAGSWVPYIPAVYEGVRTVHVLVNPFQGGRAQLVLGPAEEAPVDPEADPLPQTPPAPPAETVQVSVTITPTWSGTWRVSRGAFDRWNLTSYGGRSDLYQGDGYGSGLLVGLATYGDQLVNLGATSIDSVVLSARRNGSGGGAAALTVQGSPHGARPASVPTGSGDVALTGAVGTGAWAQAALPGLTREGLRTGALRGLVAVGGTYSGWGGAGTPGSMALAVTYTKPN